MTKPRTISVRKVKRRLGPIIKSLKIEGRKRAETVDFAKIAALAAEIERLLEEWNSDPRE